MLHTEIKTFPVEDRRTLTLTKFLLKRFDCGGKTHNATANPKTKHQIQEHNYLQTQGFRHFQYYFLQKKKKE